MPDYGQRATDAEYCRLKSKVNVIYKKAYKEIEQKGLDFAQAHAKREAKLRQAVADGKMTQADFDAWMRGQVFQGEQWAKRKQQMADTLYHADQVAQDIINDSRYSVFAENSNYITKQIKDETGINTSFELYDANSVRRLVKEEPDLLPPQKAVGKDKSYRWYNQQIQTAITQGIIQGEGIGKIANRIGKQTGERNCTAMLRNARTMFTGAQNAGRIEGLHQAQRLGIKVRKQWMATLDSRTRDTHADLDGQIVDVDEPFISKEGNEIMYPGDPTAAPEEVWNCRCTLVCVYPEYDGTGNNGSTPVPDSVESALGITKQNPFDIDDAIEANPNHGSDRAYQINCQRCVQTYEMRRRGYDVEAMPKPKSNNTVVWGSECFIAPGQSALGAFTMGQTEAAIKKELKNAPNGSRYVIYCKWKGRNSGAHVFVAEKVGNVVRYVDLQSGRKDASVHFLNARKGEFGFFRMDDKPLTTDDAIIQATARKKGKK